jgi:hypothetical protein
MTWRQFGLVLWGGLGILLDPVTKFINRRRSK